ncbi:MAG: hypothetical protein U0Y82_01410 [Thermoleophilia bacterium]
MLAPAAGAAVRPGWTLPHSVAPAGAAYSEVTMATSRNADLVMGWLREPTCCTGTGRLVVRTRRGLKGGLSAPATLAQDGASHPAVAVTTLGVPLVAWVADGAVHAAARGRSWQSWTVAPTTGTVVTLRAAMSPTGLMSVVWVQQDGAGPATVRSASATFRGAATEPWNVDPALSTPNGPVSIGVGAGGRGVAVWPGTDGSVMSSVHDPGGAWTTAAAIAPAGAAVPSATVRVAVAPMGQAVAAWFANGAQTVQAAMLPADTGARWDTPATLTDAAPGLFTNLAVSIDNGAVVSWTGQCQGNLQAVGAMYRGGGAAWSHVPSPAFMDCSKDRNVIAGAGVVRGPRITLLSQVDMTGTDTGGVAVLATLGGAWHRGALPGPQSVAAVSASGRVATWLWTMPERRTALQWREYIAP